MNLEDLEQKALNYLKQVSNPLVPLDTLITHLRQHEALREIPVDRIREFLKDHELFRVLDAPGGMLGSIAEQLKAANLDRGPYVILETRIPTPQQILEMMQSQLISLRHSLGAALEQAKKEGNPTLEEHVQNALHKAEGLLSRLFDAAREEPAKRREPPGSP